MTETIEKTTYEVYIEPNIVSTDSEDYVLTDIDLIKDIKEMNEFSSLVNKRLWKPSQYVENRTSEYSDFRTKLYNHKPINSHLNNRWKPNQYTSKINKPSNKANLKYEVQKPKTLLRKLFSFLK